MTQTEKEKIKQVRLRGVSYSEIAKRLNLNSICESVQRIP